MSTDQAPASVEYGPESGRWTDFHRTPETVSERLKTALEMRARTAHWLFSSITKVPGLNVESTTTVYRYLRADGPTAPLPFLEASADALGIRRGWLVLGDGEPTEHGEIRRSELRKKSRQDNIDRTIHEAFPYFLTLRGLGRAAIREASRAVVDGAERAPPLAGRDRLDRYQLRFNVASALGHWLTNGLHDLVLPRISKVGDRELHSYVTLASQAIVGAVPRDSWWLDSFKGIELAPPDARAIPPETESQSTAPDHGEEHETPSRVAERIAAALEMRGHDGRWLHKALLDKGTEGVRSYSTIYRYLNPEKDASDPPIPVLDAVADVLCVRRAWIILGEGEPTEGGESRSQEIRRRERQDRIYGTINTAFPYFQHMRGLGYAAIADGFVDLMHAAENSGLSTTAGADRDALSVQTAEALGHWLMDGLQTLIHPYIPRIADTEIHVYVTLGLQALVNLLPRGNVRDESVEGAEDAETAPTPIASTPAVTARKNAARKPRGDLAVAPPNPQPARRKQTPATRPTSRTRTAVPPAAVSQPLSLAERRALVDPAVTDFYEVLGVASDSDTRAIRAAHRTLTRDLSADSADPETTVRRARIEEAYETLIDPARRKRYDQRFARR